MNLTSKHLKVTQKEREMPMLIKAASTLPRNHASPRTIAVTDFACSVVTTTVPLAMSPIAAAVT